MLFTVSHSAERDRDHPLRVFRVEPWELEEGRREHR
jgi:hypothetical protein